jgi:small GTP-binding protein
VATSNQANAGGQTLSSAAILAGHNKGHPPGVQRLLETYHTVPVDRTRCFSIIAHIDHGKSTLADKLLESTRNIWPTVKGHQQVLDTLEVERTRGITVKAQSASMIYDYTPAEAATGLAAAAGAGGALPLVGVGASSLINAALAAGAGRPATRASASGLVSVGAATAAAAAPPPSGRLPHLINLIDTPGHVDFSYEVARSLAACQGALLLIDAGQGVQAQTVANFNSAREAGLTVIPVLTKIDLQIADPEPILASLESLFGLDPEAALWTSAKTGAGIAEVLPAIIERIPAPAPSNAARTGRPLRCLLFDSWFDPYRGVVCSVLVTEGVLRPGDSITACHSGDRFTVQEVGLMAPAKVPVGTIADTRYGGAAAAAAAAAGSCAGGLGAGQIGYVIAGMKSTKQALVGDTFVHSHAPASPLAGFRPAKPVVFASLYPVDSGDFTALTTAVERLTLNDASVSVERESSSSLGFGLRCGFLGLLHMDVFHQRLQQEHETPVIITSPMVRYELQMRDGSSMACERAGDFPPSHTVESYSEPTAHVSIMTPSIFVSPLMGLLAERRGVQEDVTYLTTGGGGGGGSSSSSSASSASSAAAEAAATAAAAGAGGVDSDSSAAAVDATAAEAAEGDNDSDEDEEDEEEGALPEGGYSSSRASFAPASAVPVSALTPAALGDRVVLKYRLPWSEVVTNMYDAVKSVRAATRYVLCAVLCLPAWLSVSGLSGCAHAELFAGLAAGLAGGCQHAHLAAPTDVAPTASHQLAPSIHHHPPLPSASPPPPSASRLAAALRGLREHGLAARRLPAC